MACNGLNKASVVAELKQLVDEIEDSCSTSLDPCSCCAPDSCPHCDFPLAQISTTSSPRNPVPVTSPGIHFPKEVLEMSPKERESSRYDNFYNNYNIEWRHLNSHSSNKTQRPLCTPEKQLGQTVDGKSPCCEVPLPGPKATGSPGARRGCTMRLIPPPCGNPSGVWCAKMELCCSKPRKGC